MRLNGIFEFVIGTTKTYESVILHKEDMENKNIGMIE